jgi:serine/threonine-protein kinase
MKVCPNCQTKYPDDANFCPQETCASPEGPRRLEMIAAAASEPAPGSRYQLEGQIGGARSGEVFRARDGQTGATVVYKRVARASLPTPAVLERALRELKQLQRALSPRLARVLDFGKDAEGRLFVVSELCQGQPLDRLVTAEGPLPLDRAKKIVAQIGEALLEGQKVGVVHHDLSAKNVLVGAGDDVKVVNFVAPVPVTETVFGVPEYLSPEQAEGKLVDQRSNTYSLGGIMTLMLTGQAPFAGPDAATVVAAVQRGEVAPPSRIGAGLTPEIDRVLLKAMDKSPNRRPLTLRQFLTDVATLVGLGAGAAGDRGVGFAKTMMFAGGSPEVQKLVNQAMAARAEASANGAGQAPTAGTPPIAVVAREPGADQATPPPQLVQPAPGPVTPPPVVQPASPAIGPRRSHGAAIAATMVALPAAGARMPGQGAATPAPAPMPADLDGSGPTPPPDAQGGAAPTPKQAAGGTFRETLWFKKGDVDQMVAEARARVEAARGKGAAPAPAEAEAPTEDARPLEDRYVDDGSVTVEDRKKFSLRSGGTATALPSAGSMPGDRMSDNEMVGEMGGGKRMAIIAIVAVVVLGIIVTVVLGFRHKKVGEGATAMAPNAIPAVEPPAPVPPAPQPTPPPPAAAAAPKASAPAAPPTAAAEDDDDAPAPAPTPKAHAAAPAHKHGKKAKKKHH